VRLPRASSRAETVLLEVASSTKIAFGVSNFHARTGESTIELSGLLTHDLEGVAIALKRTLDLPLIAFQSCYVTRSHLVTLVLSFDRINVLKQGPNVPLRLRKGFVALDETTFQRLNCIDGLLEFVLE